MGTLRPRHDIKYNLPDDLASWIKRVAIKRTNARNFEISRHTYSTPMPAIILATAVFALCIGFAVLVANPTRFTNQVFAVSSLPVAAWLVCVHKAIVVG